MIYAILIQKTKVVGTHFRYSAKDKLGSGGKKTKTKRLPFREM